MKKPIILFAFVSTFIAVVITVFWFFLRPQHSPQAATYPDIVRHTPRSGVTKSTQEYVAIRSEIRTQIEEKQTSNSPFRFDLVFIFDALSRVTIDEEGDVIVNHHTRELLESAFMRMTSDLSATELEELTELIKLGIHGKAGEQASKIIIDYYHYRIAENRFIATAYGGDISDVESNFEQVKAIRRAELGYDIADKLFGLDELHNSYMIASMRIQSDGALSDEEKATEQAKLSMNFEENSKKYLSAAK